jgi:hypothetical protein
MNENTSFKQYLNECGYGLMEYQEQVYKACLSLGNYTNIDLYYQDEIEKAFDKQEPVNEVAARICAMFDEDYGKASMTPENGYEEYEEPFIDQYDFSNDFMGEATENKKEDDGLSDGESYEQWKEYVFKYLDKRVDVDKIKELGTYIKDFIKQEYDNGEPSWFACAESIVNYARIKYPDAVKDRASNAFSITESRKDEAFIQDDRGSVDVEDLAAQIEKKAGFLDDELNELPGNNVLITPAADYIASFYAAQSMPKNGMIAWGARDLKSFAARLEQMEPEEAVENTRSIMVAKPSEDLKYKFFEEIKADVRERRAAEEERRRNEYLNSEEHRNMNDPGWRGPNGTWSTD